MDIIILFMVVSLSFGMSYLLIWERDELDAHLWVLIERGSFQVISRWNWSIELSLLYMHVILSFPHLFKRLQCLILCEKRWNLVYFKLNPTRRLASRQVRVKQSELRMKSLISQKIEKMEPTDKSSTRRSDPSIIRQSWARRERERESAHVTLIYDMARILMWPPMWLIRLLYKLNNGKLPTNFEWKNYATMECNSN